MKIKTTLFALCLFSATAAFAQYGAASYISNEPRAYDFVSHPAHAAYAPLSEERGIVGGTSYTSAQGERPFSDFPQAAPVPLGTYAREIKKQHAQLKKSPVVWINQ
jgi:hypothetical protein